MDKGERYDCPNTTLLMVASRSTGDPPRDESRWSLTVVNCGHTEDGGP